MKVKSSICLFLVLVLTAALIFGAYNGFSIKDTTIFPGAANMRMGLDIAGGVRLVYKPVGGEVTQDGLKVAQTVFRKRLDIKGLNEDSIDKYAREAAIEVFKVSNFIPGNIDDPDNYTPYNSVKLASIKIPSELTVNN